jgi:hypothetical protein
MTSALCEPQAIIPPANQPTNFTCNWPTNQPEALLRKQPTNRSLKVEVGWLVATLSRAMGQGQLHWGRYRYVLFDRRRSLCRHRREVSCCKELSLERTRLGTERGVVLASPYGSSTYTVSQHEEYSTVCLDNN